MILVHWIFKQVVVLVISKLTHSSRLMSLSVGYLVTYLGVIRKMISFLKSLIESGMFVIGQVLEWVKEVIPGYWMA